MDCWQELALVVVLLRGQVTKPTEDTLGSQIRQLPTSMELSIGHRFQGSLDVGINSTRKGHRCSQRGRQIIAELEPLERLLKWQADEN
jgi:hypothetical protein